MKKFIFCIIIIASAGCKAAEIPLSKVSPTADEISEKVSIGKTWVAQICKNNIGYLYQQYYKQLQILRTIILEHRAALKTSSVWPTAVTDQQITQALELITFVLDCHEKERDFKLREEAMHELDITKYFRELYKSSSEELGQLVLLNKTELTEAQTLKITVLRGINAHLMYQAYPAQGRATLEELGKLRQFTAFEKASLQYCILCEYRLNEAKVDLKQEKNFYEQTKAREIEHLKARYSQAFQGYNGTYTFEK